MTAADELMARCLHRAFRPLSEMPVGERLLEEALRRPRLTKHRRDAIIDALVRLRCSSSDQRPLAKFSNDDLIRELVAYRRDFTSMENFQLRLLVTPEMTSLTRHKQV